MMRLFWAIVAVLAILTGVLVVRERSRAPKEVVLNEPPAAAAPVEPAAPKVETPPADVVKASEPVAEVATSAPEAPAVESPAPVAKVEEPKDTIAAIDTPVSRVEAPPAVASAPAPASSAAPFTPEVGAPVTSVPVKLEKQDDGWTRVDDRFMIRGAGTVEDPYVIPWDILVSASETYRPRLGRKVLPDRVTMLNGKHVRVTGFVLFPLLAQETSELLLMRNQWDGCCIGVPPTPYDALEVKLVTPATRQDLFVQYATLEGTMKVEPYVNRDWLLGLYVLEDTKVLKMSDEGVKRPTHAPGQPPPGGAAPVTLPQGESESAP